MKRTLLSLSLMMMPVIAQAQDMSLVVHAGPVADQISESFALNTFGCSGQNQSPSLTWTKGPEGTKSYAVTMFDPDAPTGSGWWHWTVFNIPANRLGLPQGVSATSIPGEGIMQGRNDFGSPSYGGPCPPEGTTHHYVFTVWALRVEKLPLDTNASGAMVGFMVRQNAAASASTTLSYGWK